uniref:Secreted protein n=1 Tax=Knipowitschia caucasica TaxID=637954 RepID=A0AAV2MQN8_KNICA
MVLSVLVVEAVSVGRSVAVQVAVPTLTLPRSSLDTVPSEILAGSRGSLSALQLRSAGQRRDRGGARGRVVLVPTDFMANSCSPATPLPTLPIVGYGQGEEARSQSPPLTTTSVPFLCIPVGKGGFSGSCISTTSSWL